MKTHLFLPLIFLATIFIQGCTILGFTIGGIADISNSKKGMAISIDELKILKEGTNVKIITKAGKTYKGLYDSFESRVSVDHKSVTIFRIRKMETITKIRAIEIEQVIQERTKSLILAGAVIGFLVDLIVFGLINGGI